MKLIYRQSVYKVTIFYDIKCLQVKIFIIHFVPGNIVLFHEFGIISRGNTLATENQ